MPGPGDWLSDIFGVSEWDKNPIIASWKREVIANGGDPLPSGYPYEPDKGAPVAVYYPAGIAGPRQYVLAPLSVRAAVGWERTKDQARIAEGKAAETAESVAKSMGLDKGVSGFIGKALGVPPGIVVTVAVVGGLVLGYAALVNVGVLPPIKTLVRG